MICENCKNEHDGSYATGRFCKSKCAKGFSTSKKRLEINKKVRQKLSKKFVDDFDDETFRNHVKNSKSWLNLIKNLKFPIMGSVNFYVRRRVMLLNIDTTHFFKPKTKDDIFKQGIKKPKDLKRWLIKIGRKYECEICKQEPIWQGKPLTIEVDHIDGDTTNNLETNLRFLCPHCHSQTDTYCWKNAWRKKRMNLNK